MKNVVVAELAFSKLQLQSDGAEGKVAGGSPWGVLGGECEPVGRQRPPSLAQAGVGALATSVATVPLSPDSQPVLQRPKVCAVRCDEVAGSAFDSARFHASEVRGAPAKHDIPVVSRLRSFLSASRGR